MSEEYGYFDDPDPNTIWDESMNYGSDDYQEDEWYEDNGTEYYYEDEWYEDDETEYYYGEPDIQFAPIHLHTAHPRLLEGAQVDEWKPAIPFMRLTWAGKQGK